jgi:hypothetical protein
MGGYGSTRWDSHSKKYAVEDGYALKIKTIYSSLVPYWNGTITWSRNGEKIASIGYRVITGDEFPIAIQLVYTWRGKDINYRVDLNTSPLPWGGHRYWFTCPNSSCRRRVANLYLPPGNPYFACRTCHRLTYRSCQESGQSEGFFRSMAGLMQDIYPGATAKDMEALLLDDRYTKHMEQILWEKYSKYLANLPDPYEHYLTADQLCEQTGLAREGLEQLSAIRLLLPDHDGKFRPKLLKWAKKLAYLLNEGWSLDEIKRWAKGRFQTDNPRQWPPNRHDWQL